MTKIRVYSSFLAVFLILLAMAKVHAEVSLNGLATHSELGKELFIAGLYTTTPSTNRSEILVAKEEKQIQVRVTTDKLSSRRFKRMWIEGMAVNASQEELKEQSNNMATFANMLKVRMIAGDIFTVERFIEGTDSGVRININGAPLGELSDASFFDLLLRTWLGPVPLSSEFRSSLTSAGNIDSALLNRFEATKPSDERIAETESALQSIGGQTVAAVPAPSNPTISGPTISAPTKPPAVASAPRINGAPSPSDTGVAIAPPTLTELTPPPGVKSKETTSDPAKPVTTPPVTNVASVKPASSILEDDEDDGPALTAESIFRQQVYVSELRKHTYNYLNYPNAALNRGKEGNLRMQIVIDREGNILQFELVEASKFKPFNREAEKAIKKASPFPPVPKEVSGETFTFSLPIVFVLGN